MTFASTLNKETPQSVWKEQKDLGARLLFTIPSGSSEEDMQGFISTMGSKDNEDEFFFPVLTLCVEKPSGGAIVSTLVFPSQDVYLNFIDKIHVDAYTSFSRTNDHFLN